MTDSRIGKFVENKSEKAALRFSLSLKLLVSFLVISLVPLGLFLFINISATKKSLESEASKSLFASSCQTRQRLNGFFLSNLGIIRTESNLPDIARFLLLSPSEQQRLSERIRIAETLESFMQKNRQFLSSYALLDISGRNVFDCVAKNIGQDLSGRLYFKEALESGLAFASDIEFDQKTGKGYLYFSCPVRDSNKKFIGVLRARYAAAVIQQLIVKDTGLLGPKSFAMVLNRNNLVLANGMYSHGAVNDLMFSSFSEFDNEQKGLKKNRRHYPLEEKRIIGPGFLQFERGITGADKESPFFSCPIPFASNDVYAGAVSFVGQVAWKVVFFQPRQAFLAPANKQAKDMLYLAATVAFFVSILALCLANYLGWPIRELTSLVKRIPNQDLSYVIIVKEDDNADTMPFFQAVKQGLNRIIINVKDVFRSFYISMRQRVNPKSQIADSRASNDESGRKKVKHISIAKKRRNDEIGILFNGFVDMIEQMQMRVLESKHLQTDLTNSVSHFRTLFSTLQQAVDKQDYTARLVPSCDDDDLVLSVNNLLLTLEQAQSARTDQNWLKSGQAELVRIISREINILILTQKALDFIAAYLNAMVGTLYVLDENAKHFELTASYAFEKQNGFVDVIKAGQGLAGQAAEQKAVMEITNVPPDYLTIHSSLIHAAPKTVIIVPFVFETCVNAVLELGTFEKLSAIQKEFLKSSGEILAVSINTALFSKKIAGSGSLRN